MLKSNSILTLLDLYYCIADEGAIPSWSTSYGPEIGSTHMKSINLGFPKQIWVNDKTTIIDDIQSTALAA